MTSALGLNRCPPYAFTCGFEDPRFPRHPRRLPLLEDAAYATDLPSVGLDALIDLVATGQLVAVVGHSAVDRLGDHVVAVPVAGLPVIDVQLAWPADADDLRIVGLVDVIEQLHRREQAVAARAPLTVVQ